MEESAEAFRPPHPSPKKEKKKRGTPSLSFLLLTQGGERSLRALRNGSNLLWFTANEVRVALGRAPFKPPRGSPHPFDLIHLAASARLNAALASVMRMLYLIRMTEQQIRSIIRDELRSLLGRAATEPVEDPPPSDPHPDLARFLDAWEALGGAATWLSAREAIVAAPAHPDAWETLVEAAEGLVGGPSVGALRAVRLDVVALGAVPGDTPRALGNVLRHLRGRVADGRRLANAYRGHEKSAKWRVEWVLGRVAA